MIIEPLKKMQKKMGKFFLPAVLLLFFILTSGLLYSTTRQNSSDYKEGQVAQESIRANKTVENTKATKQKQQLAAEAVVPEYTYQKDIADQQYQLIEQLFDMVDTVRTASEKKDDQAQKETTDNKTVHQVTEVEKIAALKKEFEKVDTDDLNFYQNISDDTYRLLFILKDADLKQVKEESLKIVEQKMTDQLRQSNLEDAR